MNKGKHILYNYRRCPYAMRARMALVRGGIPFDIYEIDFKNKPQEMLELSPKGTVPILHMNDGRVIDESIDIIRMACGNDFDSNLIATNDNDFKRALDRYKYPSRYPDKDCSNARDDGESFIKTLDDIVQATAPLSITDICIFPFVRQFANVDREWFDGLPYKNAQQWLYFCIRSDIFQQVMHKNFKGV